MSATLFIKNKYTRLYYRLIKKAKQQKILGCIRSHHIIPRSLGGDNQTDNLVNLSPRQHLICHRLLTKMTTGNARYKMICALHYMSITADGDQLTSKQYQIIQEEFSRAQSERHSGEGNPMFGKKHSDETRRKNSEARQGQHCGQKNHRYDVKMSEETKAKLSKQMKGRKLTEEHKAKCSAALRGTGTGEKNSMYGDRRWTGSKWYNNGKEQRRFHPGTEPLDFTLGRLR